MLTAYRIRLAAEDDAPALLRLAELDSQPPLAGRVLVGEVAGTPAAAISLEDGRVAADPFRWTAMLVECLRVRADALRALDEVVLADGTRLDLRPLQPEDRDGLAELFARLSPESRRRRFLGAKARLSERELAYLTDIDHVRHEAIVAVDRRDGAIVGVSRYAGYADDPHVADVATEVADDMQSKGIGTVLAARTVDRARANGFARLTATTLGENGPARALLRRLGFRTSGRYLDQLELELELA